MDYSRSDHVSRKATIGERTQPCQQRQIHEVAGTWVDVSNDDAGVDEFRSRAWLMPSFLRADESQTNLVDLRGSVPVGRTWSFWAHEIEAA